MLGGEDMSSLFVESAPRPPVPGEEGKNVAEDEKLAIAQDCKKFELEVFSWRRSSEAEGSASPARCGGWTNSLRSLLDNGEGTSIFQAFLERNGRGSLLDFWFACSGYRKLDPTGGRRPRAARAIYKHFVALGVVASELQPGTRMMVRERLTGQPDDAGLFDNAQGEIQAVLASHDYPAFLKSELFSSYVHSSNDGPNLHNKTGFLTTCLKNAGPSLKEEQQASHLEGGCLKKCSLWQKPVGFLTTQECCCQLVKLTGCAVTWVTLMHLKLSGLIIMLKRSKNSKFIFNDFAFKEENGENEAEWHHASGTTLSIAPGSLPSIPPDDPERILDEHVSRVLRTPGTPSPPAGTVHRLQTSSGCLVQHTTSSSFQGCTPHGSTNGGGSLDIAHRTLEGQCEDWSHYVARSWAHASSVGVTSPPLGCLGSSSQGPSTSRIWQWMLVGDCDTLRHCKDFPRKAVPGHQTPRCDVFGEVGDAWQPSHPFVQDPGMPPPTAPNPLTQLEEVRRRLLEIKEPEEGPTTRCVANRVQNVERKHDKDIALTVVAYYFCGQPIPYRTCVHGRLITLHQFKEILAKKGDYRYYFKKKSAEFDCGVVFQEVREDSAFLPMYEDKIICKVELQHAKD
uniref:Axin-1 n=1 Tax=Eptatretus burgeri TaxID=7764 RepID=A0A8C4R372_EPTBU